MTENQDFIGERKTMKDLKIIYDNENEERIEREYDTIMDFIDEMDSDKIDIPMLDYKNVTAVFFENPLQIKYFSTIAELLNHCKRMIK